MKTSKIILPFVFLLLVFSCTIEKRVYNKGWHIETKQRLKQQPEVISPAVPKIQGVAETDEVVTENSPIASEITIPTAIGTEITDQMTENSSDPATSEKVTIAPKKLRPVDREPTIEPFGLASFSSFGLAIVTLAVGLIPGLSLFQTIALACLALAIILGVISFIRWNLQPPGTYKRKWLTWVGTFGGLAGILFFVISLLFIISNYK